MIKKLAKSVREYKKYAFLTPILVILEVIMEVTLPVLTASLIDFGIDKGDMGHVLRIGGVLILASVVSMFFGAMAGKTAATASAGFAKNLRHDIFHNVQNFSFSNVDKFSTSGLVTRLTTDVNNLQMAFQMLTRMAFRSPCMLIFSFVVAFRIDAKLSMIFLAAIPILGIGLYFIMTHAHPTFKKVFKKYDKLNSVVQENLRGIRVVKTFTREEYETGKFKSISGDIYNGFTKAEKLLALNGPLMQFCLYSCMLLVSWFGARAIVACGGNAETGLSTGELLSLITYAMQILSSLMMISMFFVMMTISKASAERIHEILIEEPDLKNPENPCMRVENGDIKFKNVAFSYKKDSEKPCLLDINLHIKSGQTVGIIGATGSAKSTLVQLIPRLYDVSSGAVLVGDKDVREYDINTLRDSVSMVLQKNVLFSGTVAENLRWANPDATDEELKKACRLASADGFISEMPDGYNTYVEQGGTNFSGGQKQRLCIARAILKKPKILILDDSTSAVDTKTDARIRRAFREEIPDTTKIIIAQRISSVKDADMIIVMEDGKIDSIGTHNELIEKCGIYREVYESQMEGGMKDDE